MTEKIITYLNLKLAQLNYASSIFGLCSKIEDAKGHAEPMQYCSGGEFKSIDLDFTNGTAYWRRIAPTATPENEGSATASCEIALEITERLRLIMYVPKSKLSTDDTYSDDRVAYTILKHLTTKSAQFKNYLKAKRVVVTVDNFNVDRKQIMADEYTDPGRQAIKYENVYLAVEISVKVTINKNCIDSECPIEFGEVDLPVQN